MDVKQKLGEMAVRVEEELKKYFQQEIDQTGGLEREMWQHTAEFTLRKAKRVRAALVYYGYVLVGGRQINRKLLDAQIAVELIHAGLLMHDDVIDEDQLRRGEMTTWKFFEGKYKSRKFGESMAICAGDLAMMAGMELLSGKAAKLAASGIVKTAVGEALDSELETRGKASETETLEMVRLKTALYTFENPLMIGAVMAGPADSAGRQESELQIIRDYSRGLGIAFQLQDDILGMFGDESKTGKAADSDIKQGKLTILAAKVKNERFEEIYGKKDLTVNEVEEVRQIVKESGSLKYCQKLIKENAEKAREATAKMREKGWNQEAIEFLEELVIYVTEREN